MGKRIDRILSALKRTKLHREVAELHRENDLLARQVAKGRGDRVIGYDREYIIRSGIAHPRLDPRVLIHLPDMVFVVGASVDKIVMESTKEGWSFEPNFACKCVKCWTEYDSMMEECDYAGCESTEFRQPDPSQLKAPTEFFENVNPEKSWKDIQKSCIDYNINIDDVYLELIETIGGDPSQLWALPSERMRPAVEKGRRNRLGNGEFFCPHCYDAETDRHYGKDERKCPDCNSPLEETAYVEIAERGDTVIGRWARDEVLHYNSRSRGLALFGRSKLVRIWSIAQSLRWMELYQWQAYSSNQDPDSITSFPGMTQDEVNTMTKKSLEFRKRNPGAKNNIFLGTAEAPVHTKLIDSLADLQAGEMMKLFREHVAISLGVSLQSLGIQTPGKLGRETEVIEVSYDTIEEYQSQFEEFVNEQILTLFDEPEVTDWHYELHTPKKDDLLRRAQIKQINASSISSLNQIAEIEIEDEELLDFTVTEFRKVPLTPPSPAGRFDVASPRSPVGVLSDRNDKVRIPIYVTDGDWTAPADVWQGDTISKGLTPRNLPQDDAVSGLRQLEDKMASEILSKFERELRRVIAGAKGKTEKQLTAQVERVLSRFEKEISKAVGGHVRDIYTKALEEQVPVFADKDVRFEQRDESALKLLAEKKDGFIPTLKTFGKDTRKKFEGIIRDAYRKPGEFDLDRMVRRMNEGLDEDRSKLERIARTETTRISNTARSNQYKKYAEKDDLYDWIVSKDHRLCPICIKIEEGNPYTLDEIAKVTSQGFGPFVPHPMCRCTFVRIVPTGEET